MKSSKIIPIFLPYAGCKHRCVFCDQLGSTGVSRRPSPNEIDEKVAEYLKTGSSYEIAFYGGTFTGLPIEVQKVYLDSVVKWFGRGVTGVRVSTRPDEIDENVAVLLKEHGVRVVEIGAQSMFDDVLEMSKRGHTVEDTLKAVEMLKKHCFTVGIHLMAGLPGSDREKDMRSAEIVSGLGVDTVRVHPTLVFKNTELERMTVSGLYRPLTLEDGIDVSAEMVMVLESNGVKVIRIGLYVPPELAENVVAGPYHPSFGELVRNEIVYKVALKLSVGRIEYDKRHEGWVFGHGNAERLKKAGVELVRSNRFTFDGVEYEKTLRRYRRWSG